MNIHSTAIIDEGAQLGPGVKVGPCAVIESDTSIGARSEIRAHASVKRFSVIGEDNVVYEGAVVGGEPQDLGFSECRSAVRIGDRNHIREGVTIHRGTKPDSATVIGSDCYLMAYAHVAHNCYVGDRVILANNVALAGYVEVADRVFISAGVAVHQFCRLGRLAMIGGNSKIVQDCLPFVTTDGQPGRACGLNLVGLRRAGFSAASVRKLKEAYRLLLRSGLRLDEALVQLGSLDDANVSELIDFIRGSRRGFCHEQRSHRRDD
jgi:UDP-N-acetylglucosamine acyltransferase